MRLLDSLESEVKIKKSKKKAIYVPPLTDKEKEELDHKEKGWDEFDKGIAEPGQ